MGVKALFLGALFLTTTGCMTLENRRDLYSPDWPTSRSQTVRQARTKRATTTTTTTTTTLRESAPAAREPEEVLTLPNE